jgi:hypothetical protein
MLTITNHSRSLHNLGGGGDDDDDEININIPTGGWTSRPFWFDDMNRDTSFFDEMSFFGFGFGFVNTIRYYRNRILMDANFQYLYRKLWKIYRI